MDQQRRTFSPLHAAKEWLHRVLVDIRGQDQVEYAVFVGLIALVAALSLPAIADRVSDVFNQTKAVLEEEGNCANPNPGTFQGRSPCAP